MEADLEQNSHSIGKLQEEDDQQTSHFMEKKEAVIGIMATIYIVESLLQVLVVVQQLVLVMIGMVVLVEV